jgi:thiamine pyrophosphate-dependent acetolactate synthase large subunit-like protein
MLDRRAFVRDLLSERDSLLVVTGLGSPTYDAAACGDHPLNFYLWGAMGSAAMIGLGLALAQPSRRVLVLTGDGEALMGMGSLATIGVKQPGNLVIVVLDNQHYGETGMQASHTQAGVDLVAVAKACRFAGGLHVSDMGEVIRVRDLVHNGRGPILVQARITSDPTPRVLPTRDGHAIKLRFMEAVSRLGG